MNTRWLPKTNAIFIEDPFEQPENAARAVAHLQLTGIGEVFSNTHNHLINPHQMRNTIIPSLVRREVSHLLLGATSRANIRPYPWSNQYAPRGYHPSPPSQRQFQNTRKVDRPKNMTGHDGKQPPVGEGLSVNPQLLRERPRNQQQSAVRQKTAPPVPPIVRPARPNIVQPSRNGIVGSLMGLKASPAAQVQQVWRQKLFEK